MVNPSNPSAFIPLPDALRNLPQYNAMLYPDPRLAAQASEAAESQLTEEQKIQRDWPRFEEGEHFILKGVAFRVHEIGESRMVLKFA